MTETHNPLQSLPLLASIPGLQHSRPDLRTVLEQLAATLKADLSWSRAEIFQAGEHLLEWRKSESLEGLWKVPPVMLTATLDDAIGQGLKIIHLYAELAGMAVRPLGLMLSPAAIIAACKEALPDLLGFTVLQFHSEETVCDMVDKLPPATRVIAGGPIFRAMSEAEIEKKDYLVLKDIRHFIDFLLRYHHGDRSGRQDQALL